MGMIKDLMFITAAITLPVVGLAIAGLLIDEDEPRV
tara:strand:+ start:184 stop:291 length:108 start_codon:yes stop_codon:yes gene_type:complete